MKLRYAPNEKFFQTQWNRFPVSLDAPVFTLSHTIAGKGVLGSDYTYNHTEAGIQKRFWFSAFGYTDIILKAGKVWDKVPFPLLIMPNANLSYTIQPESYSLMNAMEFMNDEYFSWDVTYFLNGLSLIHIEMCIRDRRARDRKTDMIITASDEAFYTLFSSGDSLPYQVPVVLSLIHI